MELGKTFLVLTHRKRPSKDSKNFFELIKFAPRNRFVTSKGKKEEREREERRREREKEKGGKLVPRKSGIEKKRKKLFFVPTFHWCPHSQKDTIFSLLFFFSCWLISSSPSREGLTPPAIHGGCQYWLSCDASFLLVCFDSKE